MYENERAKRKRKKAELTVMIKEKLKELDRYVPRAREDASNVWEEE